MITSFRIAKPLTDQTSYRWSIFLTPSGSDYHQAFAWYNGPNPSADPDGDGLSNDQESIVGTNPRDPLDALAISTEHQGNSVVLNWPSKTGRKYQIYSSSDFKSWTRFGSTIQGSGNPLHFPTTPPKNSKQTFYRVQVTQ